MVRKHARRSGKGSRRSRTSSPTNEENAKQPRTPHSNASGFGQSPSSEGGPDFNMNSLPDQASFRLADGKLDVIESWLFFSEEEKMQIIDTSSFEIISKILGIRGTPSEKEKVVIDRISKDLGVDDVIEDATLMTGLRVLFIELLKKKQLTFPEETPFPPIAVAVFQVFNEHLLQVYAVHSLLSQFSLFLLWWISSSDAGWFSKLSTFGVVVLTHRAFGLAPFHFFWGLFGDNIDSSRGDDKLKSFLSAMFIINMSFWWSQRGFMLFLSLIPFSLLLLNQILESSGSQVAGLRPICKCVLLVAQLAVVYFAWYSCFQLLFCLTFFFPSLMRFLVVGSCILTSFALYLIHKLRSSALFVSAQPWLASRIWGLCFSLLCVCFLYWRSLFSTWLFLLFFSTLLLTMPDLFLSISLELISVTLPPFFDNMSALLAVQYLVIFLVNLILITATFICYIVIYPLEKFRSKPRDPESN